MTSGLVEHSPRTTDLLRFVDEWYAEARRLKRRGDLSPLRESDNWDAESVGVERCANTLRDYLENTLGVRPEEEGNEDGTE
ncbi:MAG: hypothetical protein GTO22_14440 [Gemmatimonadales bacterium]|nr:hypothetical protein [Gemmatimonadales bacterium]